MAAPPPAFPKLVWNRDTDGGRYAPPDGDGKGKAPAKPQEHRDYEKQEKGRPPHPGEESRHDEGPRGGEGKDERKPIPEVDPSTDPPRSSPGA